MGTFYDPIGKRLSAQLRIAEIDGLLEDIHVGLMLNTTVGRLMGRAVLLRMETSLRAERQRLCDELADRYPPSP